MEELLYLIIIVGGFCFLVGVAVPIALVLYYKLFKRSKKSVKQILDYINF